MKQITSALISVFDKTGLAPIIQEMHRLNIQMYSTGGTQKFIEEMGIPVTPVEDITHFPEETMTETNNTLRSMAFNTSIA